MTTGGRQICYTDRMAEQQSVISAPAVPLTASGLVTPENFPGFGSRLRRSFRRFGSKPFTFLGVALLAWALPALGLVWLAMRASEGGLAALAAGLRTGTAVTGLTIAAALVVFFVLRAAVSAAAAFKVSGFKALGVGIARSGWYLATAATVFLTAVAPTLLVLPALVLLPRLLLIPPVILIERRHDFDAMLRSRDLATGHTFRLLAEIFLLNLPVIAVTAGVFAVGQAAGVTAPSVADPLTAFAPAAVLAAAAAWVIAEILFLPLNSVFLQVFYEDTVKEKGWTWEPNAGRRRLYQTLAAVGLTLVILLPILGGRAFLQRLSTAAIGVPAVKTEAVVPTTVPETAAPATPTLPEPGTPEARDLERYQHMSLIKIALASYEADYSRYPMTLDLLAPRYLETVPADPKSGLSYAYAHSLKDYLVGFELEGAVFALAAGPHAMSSQGFDLPATGGLELPGITPAPTTAPETESQPPAATEPSSSSAQLFEEPYGDEENGEAPALPTEDTVVPPQGETAPAAPTDSDGDGLTDEEEQGLGTDPNAADTDGDGLTDGEEAIVYATDPLAKDTDSDSYGDGEEVGHGYSPKGSGKLSPADKENIEAGRKRLDEILAGAAASAL
jgi:hypothetical protein